MKNTISLIACISILLCSNDCIAQSNFWEKVSDLSRPNVYNERITAIAVDHAGTVFIATSNDGLFYSTNNGASWNPTFRGLENSNVFILNLTVGNDGSIYVGAQHSSYASNDKGKTYRTFDQSAQKAITANSKGIIFVGSGMVFRSTNSGSTFEVIESGMTNWGIGQLIIDLNNVLYVALSGGGLAGNLYRSTDDGSSWQEFHQIFHKQSIDYVATNSHGTFLVGMRKYMMRSSDNGTTWAIVDSTELSDATSIHFGLNGMVYAMTPRGVYRSDDYGVTWSKLNFSYGNSLPHVAINATGRLFVGTERSGVLTSIDNGDSWIPVNAGLGIFRINTLYADRFKKLYAGTSHGLFTSTDDGDSWSFVDLGIINPKVFCIAKDLDDVTILGTSNGFYRGGLGSDVFQCLPGFMGGNMTSLTVDTRGIIYATFGYGGFYRSISRGYDWTQLFPSTEMPFVPHVVMADSLGVVYGFGEGYGNMMYSTDGGMRWTQRFHDFMPYVMTGGITFSRRDGTVLRGSVNYGYYWTIDYQDYKIPLQNSSLISNTSGQIFVMTANGKCYRTFDYDYKSLFPISLSAGLTDTSIVKTIINVDGKLFAASTDHIFRTRVTHELKKPQLQSPPDRAIGINNNHLFTWNAVPSATRYHLQVLRGPYKTVITDTILLADTSFVFREMKKNNLYLWRVRAINNDGISEWLPEQTFASWIDIPDSPTRLNPTSNVVEYYQKILLSWTPPDGAESYRVQLAHDNTFINVILDTVVVHTNLQLQALPPLITVYWRVNATNAIGTSPWSSIAKFRTDSSRIPNSVTLEQKRPQINIGLSQNFPNPFSQSTAISYKLSARSDVKLEVFDLFGRKVAALVDEVKEAGKHSVEFDAAPLPNGVYLYRLTSGNRSFSMKAIVAK